LIVLPFSTTWNAVRTSPSDRTRNPVPWDTSGDSFDTGFAGACEDAHPARTPDSMSSKVMHFI